MDRILIRWVRVDCGRCVLIEIARLYDFASSVFLNCYAPQESFAQTFFSVQFSRSCMLVVQRYEKGREHVISIT